MEKSHIGLMQCYFCGGDAGIALDKALRKTLPHKGVYDMTPCNDCKKYMKLGIIFIGIASDTNEYEMGKGEGFPNPRRVGLFCVVKEEAFKRMPLDEVFIDYGLKNRFMFIAEDAWDKIGLPREDINNMPKEESTNE